MHQVEDSLDAVVAIDEFAVAPFVVAFVRNFLDKFHNFLVLGFEEIDKLERSFLLIFYFINKLKLILHVGYGSVAYGLKL